MPKNYEDLNDSLGSFESSIVPSASRISLVQPFVDVVLLAVAGSEQDATATILAAELAARLEATITVCCTRDPKTSDPAEAIARAVDALAGRTPSVAARVVDASGKPPAIEILDIAARSGAGVVVVPAPYGDDLQLCSDESLGHVVDILLAETQLPLLLVRQPLPHPQRCFRHIVTPVHVTARACASAASWAFAIVNRKGTFEVVSVVDAADADEPQPLEEQLRRHRKRLGNLVAAVQRHGAEVGVAVRTEIEVGRTIDRLLAHSESSPSLLCATLPTDRKSEAFHRLHDLVLATKHPVLTVRAAD